MQKYSLINISPIIKIYLVLQLCIRIILACYAQMHNQTHCFVQCFALGVVFDVLVLCYVLPVSECISILFYKALSLKIFKYITYLSYIFLCVLLLALAVGEIGFWDEFSTRFNFIAVDYLVYTREVMGMLKTALPIPFSALIFALIFGGYLIVSRCDIANYLRRYNIKHKVMVIGVALVVDVLAFYYIDSAKISVFAYEDNRYSQELSKNGIYELFRAFSQNSLNYYDFYPTLDRTLSATTIRKTIEAANASFLNDSDIKRAIDNRFVNNQSLVLNERKISNANVIIILVESLSAEFLGFFGNNKGLTPHLDNLIENSIVFKNLYATGTRTVRGIEAITLSMPPLPGSAIVRRNDNHNLENNVGKIFHDLQYDVSFIYGGYSYFDNMLNYFAGNGYKVIDRLDIPSSEIESENIWGVADEHIFTKAIQVFEQTHSRNKKFFSIILTTSNHRPFTFPANRIDLAQGSRDAAIKYTDYAIGKFLRDASSKEWFDNTIFVIVADHCASSAGKTDLPIERYHIPMIIYAPKLLKPKAIESLASQIDLAPTLLALMKIDYSSSFFGSDVINFPKNRAFISTYQLLGMMNSRALAILYPGKRFAIREGSPLSRLAHEERVEGVNESVKLRAYRKLRDGFELVTMPQSSEIEFGKECSAVGCGNDDLEVEIISFYQNAYDLFYQTK
ncbi:Lipoteichoic acid synthase family protein [Rickettsiales endosymbiont of Paramecium tredecaurelia]|uniref:LTA synthase family protein n=1 Tax=Candidatus Sarmatiella mevalonica TaxID=2770581 RepID=UPI00192301AE|nr:LTA synthase family protein [Candidatus Sarmatiella mevalonica]MBL3285038.1 Lipoteichoic acid synthase family protein [Candidatus Sarmatiella mevalonica]